MYSQLHQKWMSNPFQDRSLRIDMFHLFQFDDVGFCEDFHGVMRELSVGASFFFRGWRRAASFC